MKKEEKICKTLDEIGVLYKRFDHEPLYTVDAAKEIDEKIGVKICKNLFLSTNHGQDFYLLTMVGDKKFNTGKVSKQLGVPRLTFASAEDMEKYLDITPGSVSPLGLLNDKNKKVNFIIDKDILVMEKISIHPCVNTSTLLIETRDLTDKVLPFCGHKHTEVEV